MANQKIGFEIQWKIENLISWLQTRDDILYSPQFLAETLANTRWKLRLSPNWELAEKYISLALQRDIEDDYPQSINLNYDLSFLGGDGMPLKSKTFKKEFAPKSVSHELNLKQIEILELRKEDYMSKGDLIVCCKMWRSMSSISKPGRCIIQSVIGENRIVMLGKLDPTLAYQTVNFTSTSTDISFISFDVYLNYDLHPPDSMIFEKNRVECKSFSWYKCKLFLYNDRGKKKCYSKSFELYYLLNANKNVRFLGHNFCNVIYYSRSIIPILTPKLKIELEINYYPAVESERIEYEYKSSETGPCGEEATKNLNDSKNISSSTSNELPMSEHEEKNYDSEEDKSGCEDEYFDAPAMEHMLSTTMKKDLMSLYDDRLFCDIKLQTETETFPAHRCVLSSRSHVFKKMFTTDMKEKVTECVNIPDISSDTIRRMLQFLYTDGTGDLDMQSAKDLYIVADKYDISSLKQRCSSFMKKNLSPSNVCEVLVLADMHQDKDLQSTAQEYVLTYDEEVFSSDEWKLFMQAYGVLAAQVMYLKCIKK